MYTLWASRPFSITIVQCSLSASLTLILIPGTSLLGRDFARLHFMGCISRDPGRNKKILGGGEEEHERELEGRDLKELKRKATRLLVLNIGSKY